MKNIIKTILLSGVLLTSFSCSDFLSPEVQNHASKSQLDELAASNPDAILSITQGLMSGVYNYLGAYVSSHDDAGIMAIGLASDLSTADMVQAANHYFFYDYTIDNRNATYRRTSFIWSWSYTLISRVNEIIGQIPADTESDELKYVLGQALSVRGFAYHMLIQKFQQTYDGNQDELGVPIYLTPNDDSESVMSRGTVESVYERIFKDLTAAYTLLEGYERPSKVYVDKSVCSAFLARAYMTTKDWTNAAKYAAEAKTGYTLMTPEQAGTSGYEKMNSGSGIEWMWGEDVTSETTNMFASFQSHICSTAAGYAGVIGTLKCMDKKLYESMSDSDARRNLYVFDSKINQYVNNKFANTAAWLSDNPFMRASEMYLIEAEAKAQAGDAAGATAVLAELMAQRDPSWNKTATVDEVFLQKRLELWGEGQIVYDYLRLKKPIIRKYDGSTHLVQVNLEPGTWRLIYAIPQSEIDNNNDITEADQNPLPTDL